MKKNNIYVLSGLGIIIILIIWLSAGSSGTETETITVPVKYGTFVIDVTTTGELEAKTSEDIKGPSKLRDYRIWNVTIKDIIADGSKVDSGDYVARLDDSELESKIQDEELELETLENDFLKTQLDTAMTLRAARDNLINLKYNLEERQIVVDQSIYEPPATQRQATIDLDKAERAYEQAVKNYKLELQKAEANMKEVTTDMKKVKNNLREMREIKEEFMVTAPKSGMLNYRRNWNGKKIAVGDQISTWDPVVARLPNLDAMISKTYINEIDISKVKTGQQVEIGVDAFPDKNYTGEIREVATMGQQLPNSNAKVYEVIIDVDGSDTILKPAMTTKNRIITARIDSSLYIPIECVHGNDTISYVYTKSLRQQIITGASNENEIIVKEGLEKGQEIYLLAPDDAEDNRLVLLDPEIVEKYERIERMKQEARQNADTTDTEQKPEQGRKKGGRRMQNGPAGK